MTWHPEDQEYELSTGKRFYAHGATLGMDENVDAVSEGHDGGVGNKEDFTLAERREMADVMIARWQQWAT